MVHLRFCSIELRNIMLQTISLSEGPHDTVEIMDESNNIICDEYGDHILEN